MKEQILFLDKSYGRTKCYVARSSRGSYYYVEVEMSPEWILPSQISTNIPKMQWYYFLSIGTKAADKT